MPEDPDALCGRLHQNQFELESSTDLDEGDHGYPSQEGLVESFPASKKEAGQKIDFGW